MLTALTHATSTRTCTRTSVDIWEATHWDHVFMDIHLYPCNLLFLEDLYTIPVFGSIHTQPPWMERR
jgi:hypothetical protein